MLTDDRKQRLDSAFDAVKFKESPVYPLLKEILSSFKDRAVENLALPFESEEMDREAAREVRAANALLEHIESELSQRISEIRNVATEMNVDLDDLNIRRMIDE